MVLKMRKFIKIIFLIFLCSSFLKNLLALETPAKEALIIDLVNGQILLDKNSTNKTYPSSMTKMMTALVAFEHLKEGKISLNQSVPVSEKAWKKGGSKMFIEVGSKVTINELLHGVIVQSGNDASIALAEAISGTEERFAKAMNKLGKKIGLNGSNFTNSSGWPDDNHFSTVQDLAKIAEYTILNHPELYKMYSIPEYTYNGIRQDNRNPLQNSFGNDGLKTGHTEIAGYGLTASSIRDDRRLILVVNGLDSSKLRAQESERLMEWAFENHTLVNFFNKNDVIAETNTWLGKKKTVSLTTNENINITIPNALLEDTKISLEYNEPIQTPIEKNQILGKLKISVDGYIEKEFDLIASESVDTVGFLSKIIMSINYMIFGEN